MKKAFFAGFVILLPLTITFWIIKFLIDFLTDPFIGVVEDGLNLIAPVLFDPVEHRLLLVVFSKALILIVIFVFILILGFIGERFVFRSILKKTQLFFLKIPFIKIIFRMSTDITSMFFNKREKLFKKTLLISFPHEKSKTIGLMTGKFPKQFIYRQLSEKQPDYCSVLVPTAPHPISGFLILTSEEECAKIKDDADDVFKFLVSCGMHDLQNNSESQK